MSLSVDTSSNEPRFNNPVPDQEVNSAGEKSPDQNKIWSDKNIASLDGLRGLAVLLTLVEHLFWSIHDSLNTDKATVANFESTQSLWDIGWMGVSLFFVLSGFLLFMPYARAILGLKKYPSTGKFYIRRALRILPAYWASIILMVLFIAPVFLNSNHWDDLISHFFLVQNLSFATDRTLNPVFWTMAVESQFYLLLPFICFIIFTFVAKEKRKLTTGVFLVLFALSPVYYLLWGVLKRTQLSQLLDHITILEVFGYFSVFGMGMVCSLLYIAVTETNRLKFSVNQIAGWCRKASVVGWLVLPIIWIGCYLWEPLLQYRYILGGFCFGAIILGTLLGWKSWQKLFSNSILRFVGIISYSLYIWNFHLYEHVLTPITENTHSFLLTILFNILLTPVIIIPFAYIFYRIFEKPFLRARQVQRD